MTDCSTSGTLTITAAQQTSGISACTTFSGSIAVATDFTGSLTLPDTLEVLEGDFIVADTPGIDSITGGAVQSIGLLLVTNAPALTALQFPVLNLLVTLNLTSTGIGLKTLKFPAFESIAAQVFINDTALQSLDVLGSVKLIPGSLKILGNADLSEISLGLEALGGTESWLEIANNGNGGAAVSFPSLASAAFISVMNATSLDLPAFESGGLSVSFSTLTELNLPKYVDSGGNLFYVYNNADLATLSAPLLETVTGDTGVLGEYEDMGALSIQNNPLLQTIDLPALKTVGNLEFEGNLTSVTLPALTNATNLFSITSTKDLSTDCSHFTSLKGSVIHGPVTCTYPGAESSSSGSNRGSVIGGSVGGAVAFFVLLGLVIVGVVFWRMKRRGASRQAIWTSEPGGFELQRPSGGRY